MIYKARKSQKESVVSNRPTGEASKTCTGLKRKNLELCKSRGDLTFIMQHAQGISCLK